MRKKEVSAKDFFNNNFIKEEDPIYVQSGKRLRKTRIVRLKCLNCGKEFTADLYNALRIQQKCCSVKCSMQLTENFPGGNEKHPLYSRWLSMRQRCNNVNSTNYKNYGERGITIEPFFNDFKNYVDYVSSLPNYIENPPQRYQLDRIDNTKGYIRGNLRWVDYSIQAVNKRPPYDGGKYSKHCGISFNICKNRWVARLKFKDKTIYSRTFKTEEEAYEARKQFILENNLPHYID